MPHAEKTIDAQCPHTALTPHWEQPADMGKSELAPYTCEACDATFDYAEAQQYLQHAPSVLSSVGDAQTLNAPYRDRCREEAAREGGLFVCRGIDSTEYGIRTTQAG